MKVVNKKDLSGDKSLVEELAVIATASVSLSD